MYSSTISTTCSLIWEKFWKLKTKKIIFDIINMEFLIEFFIFIFWQVHYNKQARIKKIEGIFFWSYWIPLIFFYRYTDLRGWTLCLLSNMCTNLYWMIISTCDSFGWIIPEVGLTDNICLSLWTIFHSNLKQRNKNIVLNVFKNTKS